MADINQTMQDLVNAAKNLNDARAPLICKLMRRTRRHGKNRCAHSLIVEVLD